MLLGWSQADLAKHAKVSVALIARIERASMDARLRTFMAILNAYKAQGIGFIDHGNGGFGIIHLPLTRPASMREPPQVIED